jgi:hypothetical protein
MPDQRELFRTYSLQTLIDASVFTQIQTLAGDMVIRALGGLGSILTLASSGILNIQAQTGITLQMLGSGDITLQTSSLSGRTVIQSPGGVFATGNSFNVSSASYVFTAGGNDVFLAGTPNTLTCSASLPLPVDTGSNSNRLHQDMITSNGAQILSGESSGILSVGPFLSICGNKIVAPTTLTVEGDFHATGSITATGACCASDERFKNNVTDVSPETLLDMARTLRPVTWNWKDAYLEVDPKARQRPRDVLGLVAQEARKVLPQSVALINRTVDGVRYSDFHTLDKQELVVVNLGAIQALADKMDSQERRIAELERKIAIFLNSPRTGELMDAGRP